MRTLTCRNWGGLVIVISLIAVLLALPTTAPAQHKQGDNEESVRVVAHIELPRMHVNGMFVQQRGKKSYLFLHRPVKQAFAVVDVTKPEKPVIVERSTLAGTSEARTEVSPSAPMLAITVTPDGNPAAGAAGAKPAGEMAEVVLPSETVSLVDLSDPKHPKTLKTFKGVTSYVPDDSRKLIFIVNPEGLWVVRHWQFRPMPLCTSEDALMFEPNCQ
ncbi:MAG TPA: hypothetical protein VEG63_00815 [Candidatus Acidoferrales bacterium]|nr:hypothetical protein [Candidatus Acidoferrales bacterium]